MDNVATALQPEEEQEQERLTPIAVRLLTAIQRAKDEHPRASWNQSRLARECGLGRAVISRIISGQRVLLRPTTVEKLAKGIAKAERRDPEPIVAELQYAVMRSRFV